MSKHKHSVTVIIIAKNEEDRIRDALESVHGWVDEIVVLDSGSTDSTLEICREYTDRIYETDWPGFGPQKQRALERARSDWVLRIDADERVSPELRLEIEATLDRAHITEVAFRVPWSTFYFGRFCNHGANGSAGMHLFRREGARYTADRVHGALLPGPGPIGRTRGRLLHYTVRSFEHVVEKHTRYSLAWAHDRAGRKTSMFEATGHAVARFLHEYVIRAGFLDGSRGFLKAALNAQYVFNKYAALWALNLTGESKA